MNRKSSGSVDKGWAAAFRIGFPTQREEKEDCDRNGKLSPQNITQLVGDVGSFSSLSTTVIGADIFSDIISVRWWTQFPKMWIGNQVYPLTKEDWHQFPKPDGRERSPWPKRQIIASKYHADCEICGFVFLTEHDSDWDRYFEWYNLSKMTDTIP